MTGERFVTGERPVTGESEAEARESEAGYWEVRGSEWRAEDGKWEVDQHRTIDVSYKQAVPGYSCRCIILTCRLRTNGCKTVKGHAIIVSVFTAALGGMPDPLGDR